MKYNAITEGIFLERPNRFVAKVLVDGRQELAHVKNTGRCRELLIPGVCVYLEKNNNPQRKTAFSLIAVQKGERLINMDSQAPNVVAEEYIKSGHVVEGLTYLKREYKYKDSRFDFYYEAGQRKGFIEVKGVTLEENGIVLFPDAPTLRGVKHLNELAQAVSFEYEAKVLFVVQMENVRYFTPNVRAHPEFARALVHARDQGVFVQALWCRVGKDTLEIAGEVPVVL